MNQCLKMFLWSILFTLPALAVEPVRIVGQCETTNYESSLLCAQDDLRQNALMLLSSSIGPDSSLSEEERISLAAYIVENLKLDGHRVFYNKNSQSMKVLAAGSLNPAVLLSDCRFWLAKNSKPSNPRLESQLVNLKSLF